MNAKLDSSIENIGMQLLFWLYLYKYPYTDHTFDFWRDIVHFQNGRQRK